jgi:RNA polymerase sigma-70 factor (ECF subfamily)
VITRTEENRLLDRILNGEQEAYAILVDSHKSYAFTIALKILNNRPEAEEAAQDAFIKAFHYLKGFNRQAKFSTWLYRIVFNTAISYKRKNRAQFQSIDNMAIAYGGGDSNQGLERNDKEVFVRQAMDKLSEANRLAIQLYYINEFSLEEVAGILNQPINTVKVRVHRARQRVGDELKKILKSEALTL